MGGYMMEERTVDVLLVGIGNLGRRFARLLTEKQSALRTQYGLSFRIVGAADSGGAAIAPCGLDGVAIDEIKQGGCSVSDMPKAGCPGMTGREMIETVAAQAVCEASPVCLDTGAEPGLSHVRTALDRGLHVCTPNKGPIVVAYRELISLAKKRGVQLRFDGTVAGGLPVLAIGTRDLRGAEIRRLATVPNLTTGFVLDRLAGGAAWDEAIEEARRGGALEGDGAWDLDGWDAAAKLVILAQTVLDLDVGIDDIQMRGIRDVDLSWLRMNSQEGCVRLLATAQKLKDGSYELCVEPMAIPLDHPLGRLGATGMGILFETDIYGKITAIIDEPTPLPSASTMLRDLLGIYIEQ